MRTVDVARPALAPRERRMLEPSSSDAAVAAIGREPRMRRPPSVGVDRPMLGEAVAGERWAPCGPGPSSRRGAQNRGEDVGIPI